MARQAPHLSSSSPRPLRLCVLMCLIGWVIGGCGTANAEARRAQRTLQIVYDSANAVTKDRHIEIDQQTQLLVGEAEIRKKLG
jgi:hypothetical protein